MRYSMWDKEISRSGKNILIRDSASLVPDKMFTPRVRNILANMDTHDGFYHSAFSCKFSGLSHPLSPHNHPWEDVATLVVTNWPV